MDVPKFRNCDKFLQVYKHYDSLQNNKIIAFKYTKSRNIRCNEIFFILLLIIWPFLKTFLINSTMTSVLWA